LRNLILTEKLVSLLQAFEAHGIPAVPFKGPVLAATVYDNLALREFIDLDILVHRQDVPRAKEILISLGYRPEYELTSAQQAAFLRHERELTFAHDDASVILELHWQVAPRPFSFSLDTNRLWDRLSQVSLGGSTVLVFSPEDLLLFLCVHGAYHLWVRLGWVCDVAESIRVHEDMDWDLLMGRADASGSKRMLFLGLLLASDLLGADLPNRVLNNVRSDATISALAAKMRERIFQYFGAFQGVFDEESHFQPLHLQMMERNQDRVHYCIRQATAPVLKDWVLWPLPVPLFPLYRILRPVRLAGTYVRKLMRRVYE
jgi:hypothetical protein